jgi:hypothetical protein
LSDTGEKMGVNATVQLLLIGFKTDYGSFMREVLYNILTQFGPPMKQVNLLKCVERKSTVNST